MYEFVCLYVCDMQASDVIVNDVLRCAYTSVSFIRFAHSSQVFFNCIWSQLMEVGYVLFEELLYV